MTAPVSNWRISIVSPFYNEQENVAPFVKELRTVLDGIDPPGGYEIILVNDGSRDDTPALLDACVEAHPGAITAIHLARNFGMEAAISAGLKHSTGDAVIILDSDLQDNPEIFPRFIEKWQEGYEVVYAIRQSRQEFFPRRFLFWAFYRILGWIANIPLPMDTGNFALMDRKMVNVLLDMPERNRFLRGLRAWAGFQQIGIPIARRARHEGKTRMGLRGQWKLAMNAIFSFSYVPLFLFRLAGAFTLLTSALLMLWVLYHKLIVGVEVKAWASQIIVTTFLGGINLLGIGVIGEYVARIHEEVQGRPNYVIHRIKERNNSKNTKTC